MDLPNSGFIDGDDNTETIAIPKKKPKGRLIVIMMTVKYVAFLTTHQQVLQKKKYVVYRESRCESINFMYEVVYILLFADDYRIGLYTWL